MPPKRSSPNAESERPLKQARLNFGQKGPPNATTKDTTPSRQIRASTSEFRGTAKAMPANVQNKGKFDSDPEKAADGFIIVEKEGDIFDAPDHAILTHACNCMGSWGSGIAAAFRKRYPKAFLAYKEHCSNFKPEQLINTTLLIPPQESKGVQHWIGCLFTSRKYGRGKDSPQQILQATSPAVRDLANQISDAKDKIGELRMCRINSGLFSVPWGRSKALIESLELGELKVPREMVVYSLPST